MANISRVEIDPAKLQKEREIAQAAYNKRPDTWAGNEALGRVLHWLGDPAAKHYFQQAIAHRLPQVEQRRGQGWSLLVIGNYYRLAGELATAQRYFQEAYEVQKDQIGNITFPEDLNYVEMQSLIQACFLLQRYEETVIYGKLFYEDSPNPRLVANILRWLAEARIEQNTTVIRAWLDDQETQIRSIAGRGRFSSTGGVSGLDLYEIVLAMFAQMQTEQL